jgi:cystathionine beta-lyase family protein involved in aluminum resistance
MNSEISDNLDLRAVASIFGDSRNLQDFERRLNDPELQISNLDLNNDNEVDYLRVIETVENRTHVIIIQSILDNDVSRCGYY